MAAFQVFCFSPQHRFSTRFCMARQKNEFFCGCRVQSGDGDPVGSDGNKKKKLLILIAGGGIGGLVLGLAARNRGFGVKVFERNLSAVRGEGAHRGPIQLQSNALAVLEAIDKEVTDKIKETGCVVGDRINGFADGITGSWFAKFDMLTPAVERGLPVTLVICRMMLQRILVDALGMEVVHNRSNVVDYVEDSDKVTVILEDGRRYEGDMLVGADGIWSKVREKLFGWQEAQYSNYTCYSGLADFEPPYINSVGYRVFLGFNQFFVACDVGDGKMQWYGFNKEPPGNTDPPSGKKKRLRELFGSWCQEVVTLISETPEHMILRRDVYDRDMINTWSRGRATLLGDAAHPMQPTLGQGGCMAIEDCYQLILELDKAVESSSNGIISTEIAAAFKRYENKRKIRVRAVHAVTRMASKLVTAYQPFLDFGSGPLSFITEMQIPHPGFLGARLFLTFGMQWLLLWLIVGHG